MHYRAMRGLLLLCIGPLLGAARVDGQQVPPFVTASLLYEHAEFDVDLEPWQYVTGEVQHHGDRLTSLVRATAARRFGERGVQVGADLYPRFGDTGYGWFGAAHSTARIFPSWRVGAELFRNVGDAFEVSAGARYMRFDTVSVGILTGSVGRYIPHWYLSIRPTVVPRGGDLLTSGDVLVRRYFGDYGHHATLRFGAGTAPAENPIAAELDRQSSVRAGVDGLSPVAGGLDLLWSAAWEREALLGERERVRLQGGIGLRHTF